MLDGIEPVQPQQVKIGVIGTMRKVFQTARGEANFESLLQAMGKDSRVELVTAEHCTAKNDGIIWAGQRAITLQTIDHLLGNRIDGLIINACNYGDEMAASQIAGAVYNGRRIPVYTYICPDDPIQPDGGRILDNECGVFPMRQQMREMMGVNPGYFPFCSIGDSTFNSAFDRFVPICSGLRAMSNITLLQVGANQPTFPAIEVNVNELRRLYGFEVVTTDLIDPYMAITRWLNGDKPDWFADLRGELTSAIDFSQTGDEFPDLPDKLTLMLGWLATTMKANECNCVSVRCWPELFAHLGMMVCGLNGLLYSLGIMAPCETDKPGVIGSALLEGLGLGDGHHHNFFADLTRWDNGCPLFWHCGPFPADNMRQCAGCSNGCQAKAHKGWIFEGIQHAGLVDGKWGQLGDSVTLAQIRNNSQHQLQLSAFNGLICDGTPTIGTHLYAKMNDPEKAWEFVNNNPFDHHCSGRVGNLIPVLKEGARWFRLDTEAAFLDNIGSAPASQPDEELEASIAT